MTDQEKIRRLRQQKGLSQKELAAKANIKNACTISKVESGSVKLKTMIKDKIIDSLETTPEFFEKYDGTANFTFHQEQVENAGQIIKTYTSEEIVKLLEAHGVPFLKYIEHLEGEVVFLRDLLQRKN